MDQTPLAPKGNTCRCGRPSWSLITDLCLELAAAREQLARQDEDLVEAIAHERNRFYGLIGGSELTLGAFKAKTRLGLETGQWT